MISNDDVLSSTNKISSIELIKPTTFEELTILIAEFKVLICPKHETGKNS